MISKSVGISLVEVLIAMALLSGGSLLLLERQLWSLREIQAQIEEGQIREAMITRLELARLNQNNTLFTPEPLSGVHFELLQEEYFGARNHKGIKLTVIAHWIDPHNISQKRSFYTLRAFK